MAQRLLKIVPPENRGNEALALSTGLAGIVTFLIRGIRPRTWWEADRAKRPKRRALVTWTVTRALLRAVILPWQAD